MSGGFGAAFFLFVIFASLPVVDESVSAPEAIRFVDVTLEWDASSGDLAEVLFRHSSARTFTRLSSTGATIDPADGRLTVAARDSRFWTAAYVRGYSSFGDVSIRREGRRAVRVRLIEPCSGELEIAIRTYGRAPADRRTAAGGAAAAWLGAADLIDPIVWSVRVIVASGGSRVETYTTDGESVPLSLDTNPVEFSELDGQEPTLIPLGIGPESNLCD